MYKYIFRASLCSPNSFEYVFLSLIDYQVIHELIIFDSASFVLDKTE